MLALIRKYPQLLLFGMLTAMFSGPGQTFLVSLFIPHIRDMLAATQTGISGIYSAATLLSACVLPFLGYLLDRVHLTKFSLICGALLALGCVILSSAQNTWMVFIGFFLVRNLGQGAMTLASSTTMARVFGSMRGKALGIANMGYPLGEAVMPLLVTSWIGIHGWRSGWLFLAGLVILFFMPAVWILLKDNPHDRAKADFENNNIAEKELSETLHGLEHWTVGRMLRDWRFYVLLIPQLIPPFYLTGLFFHQIHFMQEKGWGMQAVAAGFIFFAVVRAPISFMIGPVIDKHTAKKVYPLCLVPVALAILCLGFGKSVLWVYPYLGLAGMSMGLGMTISGALWAELYGTKHLGSLKGLMTSVVVVSTAAAPILLGVLIDGGWRLFQILAVLFAVSVLGIILAAIACLCPASQSQSTSGT